MTSIVWFRRDLRLHDHPALLTAAAEGDVVPLVVLDPPQFAEGGARSVGFLRTVAALRDATDGHLVVRTGDPVDVVPHVAREADATRVHVSVETEPYGHRRDQATRAALHENDIDLVATGGPYAVGPGVVVKPDGSPYRVFTPYSRAWRDHGAPGPAPHPPHLTWRTLPGDDLPDEPHLAADDLPTFGETAARHAWTEFLTDGLAHYDRDRDRPDLDATSRMSHHLTYGAIHPRTLLADIAASPAARTPGAHTYVTELIWREFYADVLWHRPDSEWADLRHALTGMQYDDPDIDPDAAARLDAWKQGRTGYPVVDAGMRQLLAQGWMHNRLRMIVASFLCKDLHVWWPHGARHFLTHLVDGDIASNNHGWQWAAGTGTDAAPYFRVFNPTTQGAKFDPDGRYVRRWVPELADVPGARVHDLRVTADVPDYLPPIVDHATERAEALRRYEAAR